VFTHYEKDEKIFSRQRNSGGGGTTTGRRRKQVWAIGSASHTREDSRSAMGKMSR